jgi:hypothetical protein
MSLSMNVVTQYIGTGNDRGCVKTQKSAFGNLQVRKADPVPASSLKATQQRLVDRGSIIEL